MSIDTMGKVLVSAVTVENIADLLGVREGRLTPDQVRRVSVDEALVDTGASIPLHAQAAHPATRRLSRCRRGQARTSAGTVTVQVYGAARLTVQGRECICDVTELPDSCPVLIGQIPLEALDFVVDPGRRRLIGNPEHGGEQMIELY